MAELAMGDRRRGDRLFGRGTLLVLCPDSSRTQTRDSNSKRMNKIDLIGKKAVITGGARGIGYAIAERLLISGAECSLWDRDAAELKSAAKRLSADGEVHTARVEIDKPASVARA